MKCATRRVIATATNAFPCFFSSLILFIILSIFHRIIGSVRFRPSLKLAWSSYDTFDRIAPTSSAATIGKNRSNTASLFRITAAFARNRANSKFIITDVWNATTGLESHTRRKTAVGIVCFFGSVSSSAFIIDHFKAAMFRNRFRMMMFNLSSEEANLSASIAKVITIDRLTVEQFANLLFVMFDTFVRKHGKERENFRDASAN